jgi:hypothetical protein
MAAAQPGPRYSGWWKDPVNGRLAMYYDGVKVGHMTASAFVLDKAMSTTGGITATTGGLTATAGGILATAGDIRAVAGNVRAGAVSAFATTEPTSALILKEGTAPSGAITTSSGLYASATVLRKFIAAGTLSDVET